MIVVNVKRLHVVQHRVNVTVTLGFRTVFWLCLRPLGFGWPGRAFSLRTYTSRLWFRLHQPLLRRFGTNPVRYQGEWRGQ